MATKWNPQTDPVGKNESVGRRLFDEPMLMGATQQPSFKGLDYRHFEETRGDRELSLDRLGPTGIVRSAKQYLAVRAEYDATKRNPKKQFNGWAVVSTKQLVEGFKGHRFPVIASPILANELDENVYHAHSKIPDNLDSTTAALYIRQIFVRNCTVETHSSNTKPQYFQKFRERLLEIFQAIRARIRVF